jgi:hypothetical protein
MQWRMPRRLATYEYLGELVDSALNRHAHPAKNWDRLPQHERDRRWISNFRMLSPVATLACGLRNERQSEGIRARKHGLKHGLKHGPILSGGFGALKCAAGPRGSLKYVDNEFIAISALCTLRIPVPWDVLLTNIRGFPNHRDTHGCTCANLNSTNQSCGGGGVSTGLGGHACHARLMDW